MAVLIAKLETDVHSGMNVSVLVDVHTLEIEQRRPRSEETIC
jgi:hypothetical protein